MSLTAYIRQLDGVEGRGEWRVKVKFRGKSQSTTAAAGRDGAYFGEEITWPIGRSVDSGDSLHIRVYDLSRILTNKVIGTITINLQQLERESELNLRESLTDSNHAVTTISLEFSIAYCSPDSRIGQWSEDDLIYSSKSFTDVQVIDDSLSESRSLLLDGRAAANTDDASSFISDSDGLSVVVSEANRARNLPELLDPTLNKIESFQLSVTVIEARELIGANINPCIEVQVGSVVQKTEVQLSTNAPYYNSYFPFEFKMSKVELFDLVVHFRAIAKGSMTLSRLLPGKLIGEFRLDVRTVYSSVDHVFFEKWACLIDPKDPLSGPKGFVKCTICVIEKGGQVKMPTRKPKVVGEEEDIDANLLLPIGIPIKRQMAEISVRIYRAQQLPRMTTDLMASIKQAISGEALPLADPYVQVSFAGHSARTKAIKNSYNPQWNEAITFTELFPPLCHRICVAVYDLDALRNECIATHYVDLSHIMDSGKNGFLPTLGPTWQNLYGTPRIYGYDNALHPNELLNRGLGEGVAYRGRLLMAVKAEIKAEGASAVTGVRVAAAQSVSETCISSKPADMLIAGIIYEAGAISSEIGNSGKPISFELSIGNYGNHLDGIFQEGDEDISDNDHSTTPQWCTSTTQPITAQQSQQPQYFHLPFNQTKPCLHIRFRWESQLYRMLVVNVLEKLCDDFSKSIAEAEQEHSSGSNPSSATKKLHRILRKLEITAATSAASINSCYRNAATQTQLDQHRQRLILYQLERLRLKAQSLRRKRHQPLARKLLSCQSQLQRLQSLSHEQQHSLPDVFLWLLNGQSRVAYARLPARRLLHAASEEQRGADCGCVQTLFLRKPGRHGDGEAGWSLQCQVKMHLWLGLTKDITHFHNSVPDGYSIDTFTRSRPPREIAYGAAGCLTFEFRAFIFSARNLIGSDDSGLSDAFARVVVKDQVAVTHVVPQSLSPCWDRTLRLGPVTFWVTEASLMQHPPAVIVEIFDDDAVGSPEFLGRSICSPSLHLSSTAPQLQPAVQLHQWKIYRGQTPAGQLLAAFQLQQLQPEEQGCDSGSCLASDQETVPVGIRPALCPYRVEFLFWGVRQLQRVQLMSVGHPRVTAEFGGCKLRSSVIESVADNPNFCDGVMHLDLMLPENTNFWPPLMFQCEDCRQFGRTVLVGNHIVENVLQFVIDCESDDHLAENETVQDENCDAEIVAAGAAVNHVFIAEEPELQIDTNDAAASDATTDHLQLADLRAVNAVAAAAAAASAAADTPLPGTAIEVQIPRKIPAPSKEDILELDWWARFYASVYDNGYDELQQKQKDDSADSDQENSDSAANENDLRIDFAATITEIPEFTKFDKEGKKLQKKEKRKQKKAMRKQQKRQKQQQQQQRKLNLSKKLFLEEFQHGDTQELDSLTSTEWISRIRIYPCPLEQVAEFNNFQQTFRTFPLLRGKQSISSESNRDLEVGIFKGNACIYRISQREFGQQQQQQQQQQRQLGGNALQSCYFLQRNLPVSNPVSVTVRVYIIRCLNLHPSDPNGKSDPYVILQLGNNLVNEKENYIAKQLNPIIGKCFEFCVSFPQEAVLKLLVMDWDLLTGDDLIGETVIDLEDRYFSCHRATCGLPMRYEIFGVNKWRDQQTPTAILQRLCKSIGLSQPKYEINASRVTVGGQCFFENCEVEEEGEGNSHKSPEPLALKALHNWHTIAGGGTPLVPEHVETRPLYSPSKPGIEQGKIQMWVDLFPKELGSPPPAVDISPRKPVAYELRVIIWDTADVILDDVGIIGAPSSDIFVKGWVIGCGVDEQVTDVHYRSITGEGNFNWRMIFPFNYIKSEDKITHKVKSSLFSLDEEERHSPCQLQLQVWDADIVSADDFLGGVQLTLSRMPRGAKSAKACGGFQLERGSTASRFSLFRSRRSRGWWPMMAEQKGVLVLAGKVDAELQLLTEAEAAADPAGLARNQPLPLPLPNRPETSFNWMLNPLKTLNFLIWQPYKWRIFTIICFIFLAAFFILFMYSAPGYAAQRLINLI